MQANQLPMQRGWTWLRDGVQLWRRNPALITFATFGYLLTLVVLSVVPLIGQLAASLIMPALSVGVLNACRAIDARIIQGSGNRTLAKLLCDELYQLVRMYRIQFSTTPNRPHQAFAEHHRILDAIAERDGELAELLMRRHIAASKRNVERHFKGALEQTPHKRGNA